MQINNQINKILNNAYIYSVVAKLFSVFSGILYSILLTRYFGASLRGDASVINNYAYFFCIILCMGLYQAYPYYKKEKGIALYSQFVNYISAQFLLLLLCLLPLAFLSDFEFCIQIAIILTPLKVAIKQYNYLVLIENPRKRNTSQIKLDIFDIVFLLILLIFTKSSTSFLLFYLFVQSSVTFYIAYKNLQVPILHIKPTFKGIIPFMKYGFVPMITVVLMEVNFNVDILMLERFHVSSADIGIYGLGLLLAEKLWMIPDALKEILISKLSNGRKEDEVARVTRLSCAIMAVLVVLFVLFGRWLIVFMYGDEFSYAYMVSLIILLGVIGMVFYKMVYSYDVVNGHKNANLTMLSISAIINVGLNIVLIPQMGINGAAIASLISYSLCGVLFLLYFCRKTNTHILSMVVPTKNDFSGIIHFLRK